jgi:hypothetical protein
VLARVATPFYFVLLIFAGAAWRPSPHSAWGIAVVLLLVLRVAGKIGSARVAARMNGRMRVLGDNWGHALLGQGELAIAIALNYLLYDTTVLPNVVFTATLVSVLLTDFGSARLVQRVALDYTSRVTARFGGVRAAEKR